MLLLDEVEEKDGVAIGNYHVRGGEFFLQGHFPGNPIVPGVILCEIMAQTACILVGQGLGEGHRPLYTGLDQVRFHSPVRPGDTVETRCEMLRVKHPFYFAKGSVLVGGKVCASARFSFALEEV